MPRADGTPAEPGEKSRMGAGTCDAPVATLARLDRQIGHLDFLRTHLHGMLRVVGRKDKVAEHRLTEQLRCTEARLADLEVEHDRLQAQTGWLWISCRGSAGSGFPSPSHALAAA
jgi:hypothetical protein